MHKLIRNKIPMIAEQNGNRKGMNLVKFDVKDDPKLIKLFKEKLIEEANEVMESKNDIELLYELADLTQVISEFLIYKGIKAEDLKKVVEGKEVTNGKFLHRHTGEWPIKTEVFLLAIKTEKL